MLISDTSSMTAVISVHAESASSLSVRGTQEIATSKLWRSKKETTQKNKETRQYQMKMLGGVKGVRSFTGRSTALAQVTTLILCLRKQWTTEFVCLSQHLEQFRMFSVGGENHSKVSKTTFSLTPPREGTAIHFRWNSSLLIWYVI